MIQRVSPFESTWNPQADLAEFRRAIHRLLGPATGSTEAFPPLNIYANEEEAVVSTELPGIAREEVDIAVNGSTVTLSGARKPAAIGEGGTALRQERFEGSFHRVVELPFRTEASRVKAQLQNGILVIHLPRAESDKPRKINIEHE